MTPRQVKQNLLVQFPDASIEDLIDAVKLLVEEDKKKYVRFAKKNHEKSENVKLVVACLDGCLESLSNASMAWYASTK